MNQSEVQLLRYGNEDVRPLLYQDKCDKYDYLIAVGCGALAGLVDIFMVGAPGDSMLQSWSDAQVDKAVMAFAKNCGWSPRAGNEQNVASAIGFLERKFPVNYDQAHGAATGGALKMTTKNHHMKSLAHAPDIVGLFFSILNQFTATSSFLSDGQLITISVETQELQGHNFISRLFCGVANWFGHLMSDVAGSSGSRGGTGRGSGIVIPFFELFQLCDFGSFQVGEHRNTLATVATKVFQEGYDVRFGIAMAIPVVICDLSIKLIWALKHHFYHKCPLAECIPSKKHSDLRIMLLMGEGTLCLMDGADAAIRSGGNAVTFFLRLNIIAWYRLVMLALREISIRLGLTASMQIHIDAYIRINAVLTAYMNELEQLDIERFKAETARYNEMVSALEAAHTEDTLNTILLKQYEIAGITLPWTGNFDDFMKNKDAVLVFK